MHEEGTMDGIYLSKRHGHDRNDGRSSKTPVKTPARAWALCKGNQAIHYMDEESLSGISANETKLV